MDSTHSSSLSQDNQSNLTESQHSSFTSVSTQPKVKVSAWFSVFIGNPDPTAPRFEHARFDARIPKEIFAFQRTNVVADKSAENISFVGTDRKTQDIREQIFIFRAMISLSLTFTDEMFNCVQGGCIVCNSASAESLIHRPLCVTETSYHQLVDFQETYQLMSTIASHAESITQTDQINLSIGSFISGRPYVCSLAMPVCTTIDECFRIATERAQDYIEDIIDGNILSRPANTLKNNQITEEEKCGTRGSSTHSGKMLDTRRDAKKNTT